MQPSELDADLLVDTAIIDGGAFPTHAADQPDDAHLAVPLSASDSNQLQCQGSASDAQKDRLFVLMMAYYGNAVPSMY
jgi:hypothetical protein